MLCYLIGLTCTFGSLESSTTKPFTMANYMKLNTSLLCEWVWSRSKTCNNSHLCNEVLRSCLVHLKINSCFFNKERCFLKFPISTQTSEKRTKAITTKILKRNRFFMHLETMLFFTTHPDENKVITIVGWRCFVKACTSKKIQKGSSFKSEITYHQARSILYAKRGSFYNMI